MTVKMDGKPPLLAKDSKSGAPLAGEMDAKPLHFLLVEDEPLDAELVRSELRRAGFDFTLAVVQTPRQARCHPIQAAAQASSTQCRSSASSWKRARQTWSS